MSRLLSAVAYLPGVPTSREGTKRGPCAFVGWPGTPSAFFLVPQNPAEQAEHTKDADCASGDCHKGAGDYQNKCKAPSRPAAFYAAPANFAAHTSDKLQFKLDGSEGKNGKCLGVEDHHRVQDGTKLIMWDCVDDAVGQEFTFDGDRLMYDGKCATWSNTGVTLESCSSDENQDIEVMFNKQYTHNIKFTGFGDYCLTGHSGSDAKDRVVYGESCDHEKQHWKIIQL